MKSTRSLAVLAGLTGLTGLAVAGVLLCGCGPGPAATGALTGAGPVAAANPQLRQTGSQPRLADSAAGIAREIAARWSAPGAPRPASGIPIQFRTTNLTAIVFNPGTPGGFTAFTTERHTTLVTPASTATIEASDVAAPRFATPADRALWQAAGRPALGEAPVGGQARITRIDQYTFLPQGSNLTYQQATALPADQDRLAAALAGHLRAFTADPPPGMALKEVAYLIATAPLTDRVRAAAWQVMASLPGLRSCQQPAAQPGTVELCIDSAGDETLVKANVDTGAIVMIADRLTRGSPAYPHVAVGTIIGSSTFSGP